VSENFDVWLSSLPKWLQTAAADLLGTQQRPDEAGITKLADLCLAEEKGGTDGFSSVQAGAFAITSQGVQVRLKRIEAVSGVNALDSSAKLDFGDADLAVVYGNNGCGKSGFAKLTKHAANARPRSPLLPDVFSESTPETSATFVVAKEGSAEVPVNWKSATGPVPELQHLHVFDADIARFYVTEKAEASYEPRRLRFLTALVDVCDSVKAELQRRTSSLVSALPAIPQPLRSTALSQYVQNLKASIASEALQLRVKQAANHTERLKNLETALLAADPATRITEIERTLKGLQGVAQIVSSIAQALSDERATEICAAADKAQALRVAAQGFASKTFAQAGITGVGDHAWRAMWEAARQYSDHFAFPGHTFPYLEKSGVCPLCQQPFDEHARTRMVSFEAFVRGEIEARAQAAEGDHAALVKVLPSVPSSLDWAAHFTQVPDSGNAAETFRVATALRVQALTTATNVAAVPALDPQHLRAALEARIKTLQNNRDLLLNAQKDGERAKLEAELGDLRMLDWCNDNLPAILAELERLKQVAVLDGATRRTNTAQLTKKKKELAQEELTGGYRSRFQDELAALGAKRIKVAPVESGKGAKGRISFSLAITDAKKSAPVADVLSEGEARVVALAAFLADVTVAGARTPFVFDDPVSSLDIEFEERVANRLVALSKSRQVIVYTHRLSLLTLLDEAAKKEKKVSTQVENGKAVNMRQLVLRRIEGRIGLLANNVYESKKVDQALEALTSKRLPEAKKYGDAGDVDTYTALMKACCSDLRILTERAIEEVLLAEVVKRFRRGLVTKDKLTSLAKISVSDCTLLDGLMTRLSAFEHSQPDELETGLPTYGAVLADSKALSDWIPEFRARLVPAAKA
jgi:energy-coupling factor transporter ATP-binding protein EcfA2